MSENLNEVSVEEGVAPATIEAAELGSDGLLKKGKKVSLDARKARAGYVFVLPFILGVVLIYLPILLDSIWISLTDRSNATGVTKYTFNMFSHYATAFGNSNFVASLISGIQKLIFEVPAVVIFSLFIAVVMNQKMLGRAAFRAIFFLPVIVSTGIMETINLSVAASSLTQGGIDDGSGGNGANQIVSLLDVERLFSSMKIGGELVTYVVSIVNNVYSVINYSGVQMLIFLAGLQSISPSIYEACRIDGATGWEPFWKVTFPMISPIILVNSVYTIIDAFTRTNNPVIEFIKTTSGGDINAQGKSTAMYWMYFLIIVLILAAVAAIASTFIFYQRRD